MNTEQIFSDPRVTALLMGRQWHIELGFGMAALGKYLTNLEVAAADNSQNDVFARIKALNSPAIIVPTGEITMVSPGAVIRGNVPQGSILRLNLVGPMIANGDLCSWGMDDYEEAIRAASQNPNVDGVFIRANTGGGESLAGQILHNAIKSSTKAVVVYADTLASAGIHGTLAADEIIASGKGSRIGSIGTYVSIDKEFINWYKENVDDIYADVSGDKNGAWRAYMEGDSGPFRKMATESAQMFQEEVRAYRQLKGNTEETLKGGIFWAAEAKRRGLIDGIGNMDYAMQRLQANIKRRKNNM